MSHWVTAQFKIWIVNYSFQSVDKIVAAPVQTPVQVMCILKVTMAAVKVWKSITWGDNSKYVMTMNHRLQTVTWLYNISVLKWEGRGFIMFKHHILHTYKKPLSETWGWKSRIVEHRGNGINVKAFVLNIMKGTVDQQPVVESNKVH